MISFKNRLKENTIPIYFIDWCLFTMLGMEAHIGNLHFITAIDTFEGQHPNIFIPPSFQYHHDWSCEQTLNALLQHEEVINYIHQTGKGKLLTWLLDETTERLAADLGLEICLPSVALREYWDNKVNTNRMAIQAGVPCVPHVLSSVQNYEHLCFLTPHLGEALVVQMPHGLGGQTTFFINNEKDFEKYESEICNGEEMKIMQRINCLGASLEACVTQKGVVVSPLLVELIGISEINIYKGGWSGDELFTDAFPLTIRQAAQKYTILMGEALRKVGYRGYFQPDFLIDTDSKVLYLGEMNLRFSGFTPLINNASIAQNDDPPLLLFHLAEWLNIEIDVSIDEINERLLHLPNVVPMSFLHIKNTQYAHFKPIQTGVYGFDEQGNLAFLRKALNPQDLTSENEIFWFASSNQVSKIDIGDEIGAFFMLHRATEDGKALNVKTQKWVNELLMLFQKVQ